MKRVPIHAVALAMARARLANAYDGSAKTCR